MTTAFTNLQALPIDNALPTQNTSTAGRALISNGTSVGWNTVLSMIGPGPGQTSGAAVANAILPNQIGQAGRVLSTDGAGSLSWVEDAGQNAAVNSITIGTQTFTGAVTITNVPSATTATNITGVTAIVNGGTGATTAAQALTNLGAAAANHAHNYAPVASPAFTGTPTAPTPALGNSTTQLATTAFVQNTFSTVFQQQSLASSGYQVLPGGLIIQWGNAPDDNVAKNFPVAFPNACFVIVASANPTGNYTADMSAEAVSRFQYRLLCGDIAGNNTGFWIAIGA